MSTRLLLVVVTLLGVGVAPAAEPTPGRYLLRASRGFDTDLAVGIFALEQQANQWTARLIARNTALGRVSVEKSTFADGVLRIALNVSDEEVDFEGVPTDKLHVIDGSYGNSRRLVTATLVPTTEERIERDKMTIAKVLPAPFKEYAKLEADRLEMIRVLNKATGEDREQMEQRLQKQRDKMAEVAPGLMQKMLTEFADHPLACAAGLVLLHNAYKTDAKPEQIKQWTEATLKVAERYGPRFRADVRLRLVESLGRVPAATKQTISLAQQVDRELGEHATAATRERVLRVLVAALHNAQRGEEAAPYEQRLAKLDAALEADLKARMPKFGVRPFGERKKKANRVVLVELFTGAQAAAGVAAGIAFDRVPEVYKSSEVVTLQYHLHIPGPDALGCPDADTRFEYYTQRFPGATDVVPTCFISGAPRAKGGGSFENVRSKLDAYLENINELLGDETEAKLTLKATRSGDKIAIESKIDGLGNDPQNLRLRLALIEDVVRYAGGNGLRAHTHVVRCLPGGPAGIALTSSTHTHKETVDLAELRTKLKKYLDDYARQTDPFPTPHRPMEMKNLKVVAWVQENENREVYQAIQADVVTMPAK